MGRGAKALRGEGDEGRAAHHSQCPGDCPPDNKANARLEISLNCLRLPTVNFHKNTIRVNDKYCFKCYTG